MNTFRGILDLQVETVLRALQAQQDGRCRGIERAAARRAEKLLSDSRRRMRRRVHEAVVEERRRRETALLDARHRVETAERLEVQQQYREFLQEALPLLAAELQERWRDAGLRRRWCEMAVGEAADRLAADPWTIEHPLDWSGEDTAWLEQLFESHGLPAPALQEDAAIAAGLRLRLGSACLDATIDGLMADIRGVEGRLLAAWARGLSGCGEGADA
jgi:hypothetical protein